MSTDPDNPAPGSNPLRQRVERLTQQLMAEIIEHLDIEAAVNGAMMQDKPLKIVGTLKRVLRDGYTVNTLVSRCAQCVEDGVKEAIDGSVAKLKTEMGIPS